MPPLSALLLNYLMELIISNIMSSLWFIIYSFPRLRQAGEDLPLTLDTDSLVQKCAQYVAKN